MLHKAEYAKACLRITNTAYYRSWLPSAPDRVSPLTLNDVVSSEYRAEIPMDMGDTILSEDVIALYHSGGISRQEWQRGS